MGREVRVSEQAGRSIYRWQKWQSIRSEMREPKTRRSQEHVEMEKKEKGQLTGH